MPTIKQWLVMTGLITARDLAAFAGVHESTVSRHLNGREARKTRPRIPGWFEEGLVVSTTVGRTLPPVDHLLAASRLIGQLYPQCHTHPVPGDIHDHRDHHPLFFEHAHQHPTYFNTKEGAAFLFGRMEMLEAFYPLAPVLFKSKKGVAWSPTGNPPNIVSWRWVKNTRLIDAVATYEGDVRIGFCWVARDITAEMLRWRWTNRFARVRERLLVQVSSGALFERERRRRYSFDMVEDPDPNLDFNPHLSGYVICAPDEGAIKIAIDVLPSHSLLGPIAYMYAVGHRRASRRLRLYRGRTIPVDDDVADAFRDVNVDVPEDLCPDPVRRMSEEQHG